MLEVINAIKSNNVRKIPNYDPSLLVHTRKLLKGLCHSTNGEQVRWCSIIDDVIITHYDVIVLTEESQLKISLSDLLNADSHGMVVVMMSV